MKSLSVSQLLPCVLLLAFSFAWPVAESVALPADLTHVDSGGGFTKHELLRRMAARSKARVANLQSPARAPAVTAPVHHGGGSDIGFSEYLVHLGVGTPRPQRVVLTLDTGSDLVWTQCACTVCFDQPFPVRPAVWTIIDTGTAITSFPQAVFQSVQGAFVEQVPLPVANGSTDGDGRLCFSLPPMKKAPAVPKLILHLEGADWDLLRDNYVLDNDDDGTGAGRELCVVISSAGKSDRTTIGNYQQQTTHIVYDLESNKMVFAPARCNKL